MNQLYLALEAAPTVQYSDHAPEPNDAALIQNAQAGDAEALDCLLCKYWPVMCRRAQRGCRGDLAAAEDICQEACIKVIQCLPRFVVGRSFQAWVFAFIDNEAKNWRRNLKKDCTRPHEIDINIVETIETMSARADNQSEAGERDLLSFLSERAAQLAQSQRPTAMFMLANYERLHEFPTVRAIAQAIHISQGAAQLYRRAILAFWSHILAASELDVPSRPRALL